MNTANNLAAPSATLQQALKLPSKGGVNLSASKNIALPVPELPAKNSGTKQLNTSNTSNAPSAPPKKEDEDNKKTFYLEPASDLPFGVHSDDEDEDLEYEEVPMEEFDELSDLEGEEETLETVVRNIHDKTFFGAAETTTKSEEIHASITRRPEVVDDFIRNYLSNKGMLKSLESFQNEWYELMQSGKLLKEDQIVVADVYQRNQELEESVERLRKDVTKYKEIANKARSTWDRLRKERDFHRMHHKRVVQEKNKLINDIKRLKQHYENYEPTLKAVQHKYEVAMKEKMLIKLEKDKLNQRLDSMSKQLQELSLDNQTSRQRNDNGASTQPTQPNTSSPSNIEKKPKKRNYTGLPIEDRLNPYQTQDLPSAHPERLKLVNTIQAHDLAISSIKFHPRKMILATVSDDKTWKMWAFPSGELVMSGEGHRDWIADCDFHPKGAHLATASGDGTVKIWDFAKGHATLTLSDHTQGVWSVAFHDLGDYVVTSSMDHTAKLWDVAAGRCKQTFRGHTDSVNQVSWQPYSNNMVTCSGDKTVSVWDARSGVCVATLYGHLNSVNCAAFTLRGDQLASCDADGIVKFWDLRNVADVDTIDTGAHAANKLSFDPSGHTLAVASNDFTCKLYNLRDRTRGPSGFKHRDLLGHEDAVQACLFDRSGEFLVTAGSDATIKIWN